MPYALQSLLRIRSMREDRAGLELAKARQAVAAADEAVHQREAEFAAFEKTKEARRDRIYDAVIGRVVTMDDLDRAQEGVARIDGEGVLKADNVTLAKADLKKKEEAQEVSHEHFVEAAKNRMKIAEHRSVWVQETAREDEHRQESELEDFTGKKVNEERE